MLLAAFTFFHVVLSLIGIGSGLAVFYALLTSKNFPAAITTTFLTTTAATSLTGFLFPYHGFKPSYVIGLLSLVALAIAIAALYRFHLAGAWRPTYAVSAILALYFNVFVLIAQSFQKVPALKALAPTQTEPPFQIAQLALLVAFAVFGVLATLKSRHHAVSAA